MIDEIKNFIDKDGKINVWPSKMKKKKAVLEYLSTKFEHGKIYTEKDVNKIIISWHNLNDYFLLRRGLIDYRLLERTRNGAKYWKIEMNTNNNIIDEN